jgi:hypothetical protein
MDDVEHMRNKMASGGVGPRATRVIILRRHAGLDPASIGSMLVKFMRD